MTLICKKNALYVKACVIANGIADTDGDILNTQEIKEIFTSFNNQDSFEVHHNDLPLQEVSLLENYISKTDEQLGLMTIPAGSWMIVIRVDNPNIQERILQGEFGGVSLSNRVKSECSINLTGEVRYKDLPKMDCVIPRFISFVDNPANRIGLHIYDYDTYIRKSKEKPVMDMKEFIDGLKALISKVEDEEPTEAEVEKSDEEPKEEEEDDAVETVEDETETSEEETPKIKKEESEEEVAEESSEDEETTVEKEEETLEERVAKLEEQIAKLLETEEESADEETSETTVEEVEAEAEESPKITKSRKVIKTDAKIRTKNFYEIRGRDPVTGCKIRK